MNKTKNNFWLDVLLFFIFVVVIISSFVVDNKDPNLLVWGFNRPGWVLIHVTAALAMLAGSSLHLIWHWDWIKAVFKRTRRPKPTQVRRNRLVDIAMFVLLFLIGLSGLLIWPLTGNLDEGNPLASATMLGMTYFDWKQLHAWSAVLIIALLLLHLALHWQWIVSTVRRGVAPGARCQAKKGVELKHSAVTGE